MKSPRLTGLALFLCHFEMHLRRLSIIIVVAKVADLRLLRFNGHFSSAQQITNDCAL
jgi:hypothetical protein